MEKLIYLDNAATTLRKPPGVAEAAAQAILTAGNAARGAHGAPRLHEALGRAQCGSASPYSTRRTRRTWPFRR